MNNPSSTERAFRSVAEAFGIPVVTLASTKRDNATSEARFALFHILAKTHTRYGVAKMLGRNWATIQHGLNRCEDLVSMDKKYAAKFARAIELAGK